MLSLIYKKAIAVIYERQQGAGFVSVSQIGSLRSAVTVLRHRQRRLSSPSISSFIVISDWRKTTASAAEQSPSGDNLATSSRFE
jgi:hypothetical protein